jgi:hypothetical protein
VRREAQKSEPDDANNKQGMGCGDWFRDLRLRLERGTRASRKRRERERDKKKFDRERPRTDESGMMSWKLPINTMMSN